MGKFENSSTQNGTTSLPNATTDASNEKYLLENAEVNSDCIITLTLRDPAEYSDLEIFLNGLRTDFIFENSIRNAFSFERNRDGKSVTVKPINATAEQIIGYIDENNLRPQEEGMGQKPR